jgi:hypothetical protein
MYWRDDWLAWYFNDVKYGPKTDIDTKFEIRLSQSISRPVKSYKEELLLNAQLTRDVFSGPFDIMLSGGVDSEVVLRSYVESKIPVNVFIFRYENNYNFFDVNHALRICDELNIKPKVIDFNLQKFFENDAYDIWKKGYFIDAGFLPPMKMIEYLDNIPVSGGSEPVWIWENNDWHAIFWEAYHGLAIYGRTINRPMISDWFEYSPEVIVAFSEHEKMQEFFRNFKLPKSTRFLEDFKYHVHKAVWPEIIIRPKRHGFEGHLPNQAGESKPPFMNEFNRQHVYMREERFLFTKEKLLNAITIRQ